MTNPCRDCPRRSAACHASCTDYAAWNALHQAAKSDENLLIPISALKVLVNHAMAGTCTMCFDGPDKVKACKLRKALMEVTPPVDLNLGECPYRYVIEQNDEGKYI